MGMRRTTAPLPASSRRQLSSQRGLPGGYLAAEKVQGCRSRRFHRHRLPSGGANRDTRCGAPIVGKAPARVDGPPCRPASAAAPAGAPR
jgi:hypothetical protein